LEDFLILLARILFGLVFLFSGIAHIRGRAAMEGYVKSKGIPAPALVVVGSGILLIVASLSLILGIYPEIGSLLLIIFLIPTAFLMHAYWREKDPMTRMNEQTAFYKDIALLGAAILFFVWAADIADEPGERGFVLIDQASVLVIEPAEN
jgi:putative oxidoreductase